MSQPPQGSPGGRGGFGAPYEPQPGVYGDPTMPMPQAPGSGSGGRSRGRVAALVAAVLAGVLVVGAGVWFAAGDGGSTDDKKPVAKETTAKETAAPGESGPPGERSVTRAPTADDLNAQREPGDSRVLFVQKNEVDLPGGGTEVYGPWFAGDLVTRAAYRTVAGHAVADGTEEWSLPLATSVCAAPTLPTTDGKIVLALQSDTSEGATCDRLQMVDLATGKAGWSARFQRIGVWDGLSKVNMAVNGDVLTVGRVGRTDAFRISDGKHLWDELPGNCQPFGFASGPVPLAATSCQEEGPNDHAVQHVRRIDPATGRIQWSYKVKKGWKVDQFYSVDPPVVSLRQGREKWGILILGDDGTRRSALSGPAADNYAPTCGFQEADRGRNLDACQGVAADDDTFYIATEAVADGGDISNAVAAFALETGKQKWKVEAPARQILMPLRVEDGRLLMYVSPARAKEEGTGKGGGILALPSGGGDLEPVLRHPVAASTVERTFSPPLVAYSGGRAVLVQPLLSRADDEQEQEQVVMLGFGD